jgi:hypothetical protein
MTSDLPPVRDPHGAHIVRTFHHAVSILDETESTIRDLIEGELMDIAGINRTKVSDAMLATDALVKKIIAVRVTAMKQAFRHLRDNLPSDL